jgi:hypothetical protein
LSVLASLIPFSYHHLLMMHFCFALFVDRSIHSLNFNERKTIMNRLNVIQRHIRPSVTTTTQRFFHFSPAVLSQQQSSSSSPNHHNDLIKEYFQSVKSNISNSHSDFWHGSVKIPKLFEQYVFFTVNTLIYTLNFRIQQSQVDAKIPDAIISELCSLYITLNQVCVFVLLVL